MSSPEVYDFIIIGAGISGLALAKKLTAQNHKVLVLEKSRSVGGRLATRRDADASYDHGAQFYKIQKNDVSEHDQLWNKAGVSEVWFSESDTLFKSSPKGMTALAKTLAQNLEIAFNEKLTHFVLPSAQANSEIHLTCESGQSYLAKKIILSAPLPQSLDLLKASKMGYPAELNEIQYAKALVGLFEIDAADSFDLKYIQNVNESIFSISNQMSKNVSSKLAVTVTMQPAWSDKYFEEAEEKTLKILEEQFLHFVHQQYAKIQVTKGQLKKWRFSHPIKTLSEAYLQLPEAPDVYLIGDAFGGGSIRGALRSAESLSKSLL